MIPDTFVLNYILQALNTVPTILLDRWTQLNIFEPPVGIALPKKGKWPTNDQKFMYNGSHCRKSYIFTFNRFQKEHRLQFAGLLRHKQLIVSKFSTCHCIIPPFEKRKKYEIRVEKVTVKEFVYVDTTRAVYKLDLEHE